MSGEFRGEEKEESWSGIRMRMSGSKISWREIDRRKDRSPYAPKEEPKDRPRSRRSEWVMKKYRKEADKLFMGKKGTKKHQKALNDIDRLHGTDQFETAVKAYLDQYGLPEDWSTLSLLLGLLRSGDRVRCHSGHEALL